MAPMTYYLGKSTLKNRGISCSSVMRSRFVFCTPSISFLIFALLLSPLLVLTQIRGHIRSRLASLLPTTVRAFRFCRETTSVLPSLVDSRRIAPTHAWRSQQLILFGCYFCKYSKPHLTTVGFELRDHTSSFRG